MITILLNAASDSIAITKIATNAADVAMTAIICMYIGQIILILVAGFLLYKVLEYLAQLLFDDQKRRKEKRDNKLKKEDEVRKRKDDYLETFLVFLKNQAKEEKSELKVNQYRQVLEYLIEKSQKDELDTITKAELDQFFENENPKAEKTDKASSKN